jgi:hypothetical protein
MRTADGSRCASVKLRSVSSAHQNVGGDPYVREPGDAQHSHPGSELSSYFSRRFSAGGGVDLQHCAVTDDGVRCALEYNCVRWGSHDLTPQAGIVYERDPEGLLAAARVYDDVEAPIEERPLAASQFRQIR